MHNYVDSGQVCCNVASITDLHGFYIAHINIIWTRIIELHVYINKTVVQHSAIDLKVWSLISSKQELISSLTR